MLGRIGIGAGVRIGDVMVRPGERRTKWCGLM